MTDPVSDKKRRQPKKSIKKNLEKAGDIYRARRANLFDLLPPGHIALVVSGSPPRDWRQNFTPQSNFFYLTGLDAPNAIAILSKVEPIPRFALFWKAPGEKEKIWDGPRMDLADVKKITGAEVYPVEEFPAHMPGYLKGASHLAYSLGIEEEIDRLVLNVRSRLLMQKTSRAIAPAAIVELSEFMEKMRIYKERREITILKKAIAITAEAFAQASHAACAGMYEYEIEALLHYVYRKHGAQGPGFPSIVASGDNSTILHYRYNNRRMKKKDLLLIDSGAKYDNYSADVSRTWPLGGKFSPEQKRVYRAVLEVQKNIIDSIRPGIKAVDVHEQTVRALTEKMLQLRLLKGDVDDLISHKEHQKYYPHRTSHFLGLDVHDIGGCFVKGEPRILEPGMVLTVEPGIYIRSQADVPSGYRGIGVRIEDDVLVTKKGCEVLTREIPKEIEEIEKP